MNSTEGYMVLRDKIMLDCLPAEKFNTTAVAAKFNLSDNEKIQWRHETVDGVHILPAVKVCIKILHPYVDVVVTSPCYSDKWFHLDWF